LADIRFQEGEKIVNNRGCEETYKKNAMSEYANRLNSIERIQRINTPYADTTIAYFSVVEIQKIFKRDFYFISAKYICASTEKRIAIDHQLTEVIRFLTRTRSFIESKPKQMSNLPAIPYEVFLKDTFMVRLLRLFQGIDEILMMFLGAALEGSIDNKLRLNHFRKFSSQIVCLKVIATLGDNFFTSNGKIRELPDSFLSAEQKVHLSYLKNNGNYYVNSKLGNNSPTKGIST